MKPGRSWTIKAKPPEQDDARNGVRRLGQACSRKIVKHETLGYEARKQPLDDAVLQVQMHDLVVELARVLENNGTDRRFTAPFPEFLAALAGSAQRIESVGPRRIAAFPLVQGREDVGGFST